MSGFFHRRILENMSNEKRQRVGVEFIDEQEEYVAMVAEINRNMEHFVEQQRAANLYALGVDRCLSSMIESDACRSLVLRALVRYEHLTMRHGLCKSGRNRGILTTRVIVEFDRWNSFSVDDLLSVWEGMQSKESSSSGAEGKEGADDIAEVEEFDDTTLQRHVNLKNYHKPFLQHVKALYAKIRQLAESLAEAQRTIAENNQQQQAAHELHRTELRSAAARRSADTRHHIAALDLETEKLQHKMDELTVMEGKVNTLKNELRLLKMSNTKQKGRADRIQAEAEISMQVDEPQDEYDYDQNRVQLYVGAKILELSRNFSDYLQFEEVRRLLYRVLPLVLPHSEDRNFYKLPKCVMNRMLGFNNDSSVFLTKVWKKVETFELATEEPDFSTDLDMRLSAIEEATSHVQRQQRSDTTPIAETHWLLNCVQSPNKNDVIDVDGKRCNLFHQYASTSAIYASFVKEHGDKYMCQDIFEACKPVNIVPGKVNTCLCPVCQDMILALRAAKLNFKLISRPYVLFQRLKRFLCAVLSVPNLFVNAAKLIKREEMEAHRMDVADADIAALDRDDGNQQLWSRQQISAAFWEQYGNQMWTFRGQISLLELVTTPFPEDVPARVLCRDAMPSKFYRGQLQCIGLCDERNLCPKCRRIALNADDKDLRTLRVGRLPFMEKATYGQKPSQMTFLSYENKPDEEKKHPSSTSSIMGHCYRHKVTPEDFLEHFMNTAVNYSAHTANVKSQMHGKRECDENILPRHLLIIYDFSQNMKYTNRYNHTQEDHWISKCVTLFTACARFLSQEAWDAPVINLKKGDEVSVCIDPGNRTFPHIYLTPSYRFLLFTLFYNNIFALFQRMVVNLCTYLEWSVKIK